MLGKLLLNISLLLASSSRYYKIKHFFKNLLENPNYPSKKYFDLLMIFVVISSIILLIQEVKHVLPSWLILYNYTIVTIIFLIEYLLRLWVHSDMHKIIISEYEKGSFLSSKVSLTKLLWKLFLVKFQYIKSPAAIIDLLAILPSYRPLRVLRIFLLFRVIKLLRYTKSIQNFLTVLQSKAFELFTLLLFLTFVVFISAVLIYVFEGNGQNPDIKNFFDAFYWALVTISTVGYGDISPVTFEGRTVSILVIIAGVTILAFATSIIVSAFTEKLDELKEDKSLQTVSRLDKFYLFCGYSQMAQMLASKLYAEGHNVVVMEKDKNKITLAQKHGYIAIYGDASKLKSYQQIRTSLYKNITAALVLIDDEIANIYITLTLKSFSNTLEIYTKANTRSMEQKLELAGAQHILYAYESIGQIAKEYVDNPIAFDAVNQLSSGLSKTKLEEITLYQYDLPIGKQLKEIDFFALKLILIGVTRDGDFIFKPKPDFVFETHDILLVTGDKEHIEQLKEVVLKTKRGIHS
jgi:voltage-gated potassium channel